MKLCRFELLDDPGRPRSGIFHENRLYETDGRNPIGVHDLGKIRLLPPIGQPPSVRLLRWNGERLVSEYGHPAALEGTGAEIDAPTSSEAFDLELRVAVVVKDRGERIDSDEAAGFVLGFTVVLAFVSRSAAGDSLDHPLVVGPFLTTPDELAPAPEESFLGGEWTATLSVNDEPIAGVREQDRGVFERALVERSRYVPMLPGDLVAAPPLALSPLAMGPLGRSLLPGDSVVVTVDKLGALNAKIV